MMAPPRLRAARATLLCLALGVMASACGDATPIPHLDIPVVSRSPSTTGPSGEATLPPPPPSRAPVPIQCSPPSPEPPAAPRGSALTVSGVCDFTETSRVSCSVQPDDFLFQFSRDTPDGPKLYVEVNVEFFKGPGAYEQNVHVVLDILDNGTFYGWDTTVARTTVDRGEKSGALGDVILSPLVGTPSSGTLTVTGTFACL